MIRYGTVWTYQAKFFHDNRLSEICSPFTASLNKRLAVGISGVDRILVARIINAPAKKQKLEFSHRLPIFVFLLLFYPEMAIRIVNICVVMSTAKVKLVQFRFQASGDQMIWCTFLDKV